jgi:hypothetical protein
VCNFIGRIARSLNFKFGHDGLWYTEHLDDHYKLDVFVSRDIEKILTFLGYDYERWSKGFDTIEDILAYGASSIYFNALYFSLDEQNNVDRVRNKKRKMYQAMLQYIEDNKLPYKSKLNEDQKWFHAVRAEIHFNNDFLTEVNDHRLAYGRHCLFKQLFNGDIVKAITGLEGKELGKVMQATKAAYPDFESLVLEKHDAAFVEQAVKDTVKKLANLE